MKMRTVHSSPKSGSVLLVTLMVVSLLTLIVLALSAHVRMELRQASIRQDLHMARNNARLGLELALAQLQAAAGPDQRATARADILGSGIPLTTQLWTGVWQRQTDGTLYSEPIWLVSGQQPNPAAGAGTNSVKIFPSQNNLSEIRVPLDKVLDSDANQIGQFAYWVSDEASSATLSARRLGVEKFSSGNLGLNRSLIEFVVPFGANLQTLFQNLNFDATDVQLAKNLDSLLSHQSISLLTDSGGNSFTLDSGASMMRDLTLRSYGVLENSLEGGLRRNLSDLTFRDGFLATDETARFLGPKNGVLRVESGMPSDRGVSPGAPYFSPRPILTEAVLYIGLFHTWNDAIVRLRYHVEAEFLNPYTLPLVFPSDGSSSLNRAMTLVFDNLPTISVEDITTDTNTPSLTENLNNFSSYNSSDNRRYINTWVEISPGATPNTPILKPGEVYRVMEPNPTDQPRGLARDFTQTRWSAAANTRPDNNAVIQIRAVHPPGGVKISGVPFQSGQVIHRNLPIYFSWSGLDFDDFTIFKTFNEGPNPFSRPLSGNYTIDDYIFAYHFRLDSSIQDMSSVRNLLDHSFILDPDMDTEREFIDSEGVAKDHNFLLDPVSNSPPSIVADSISLFSMLDIFADQTPRSHQPDYNPILLVDVPDDNAISVAQLTHLPIYRKPIGLIGSKKGGDYNNAFDLYYFSPKKTDPVTSQPMLINPSLRMLHDNPPSSPHHTDAAKELIVGAFNINSTSEKAWEAVLSSPVLTHSALDEDSSGMLTRAGAFFRLPIHQASSENFVVTSDELQEPHNAFAQGIRSLHDNEGMSFIRAIAREIVQTLKNRGKPFEDLSSFVNSGILQNAIDSATIMHDENSTPSKINDGLFESSSVYLKQQDLLKKIAAGISVRSDTFIIRAYGNVNQSGNNSSTIKAICEAVVQRTPLKVDGSDPMTPSDSLLNRREFKIVSFKWIIDENY